MIEGESSIPVRRRLEYPSLALQTSSQYDLRDYNMVSVSLVLTAMSARTRRHSRIAIPQRLLTTHAIPDIAKDVRRHPGRIELAGPDLQGRSCVDLFRGTPRGGVKGWDNGDLTRFRRGLVSNRRSATRRKGVGRGDGRGKGWRSSGAEVRGGRRSGRSFCVRNRRLARHVYWQTSVSVRVASQLLCVRFRNRIDEVYWLTVLAFSFFLRGIRFWVTFV
jgi:hypothetical protein